MADTSPARPIKALKKELGLWDVYAISTGAMFSSGFFLLPGLATAYAGPSTVLAYLVAGLLMIPAMLSMAELSTALPRAGGTYYFLDRSLGPVAGTVGGLGTWLALVLKSAFALLGMGAYLAITPGIASFLPGDPGVQLWIIKGLAVALTVAFAALNILGAKETTRLQGILVIALLSVLSFFVVQGLYYIIFRQPAGQLQEQFSPFMHQENGWSGFASTVGLVFVSYAGLTKVASVSEEVKRPDRNLPLGMILSLITATLIYVLGVAIMIDTVDPEALRGDYTPVATAAESFFDWLPGSVGLILIVIAALAAFASTGNAGILAASRYPLAMARDRLISKRFREVGRFGTPTLGIIATAGLMIGFILFLSAEGVAKIASAFNLFVFGLMNIAVIVMRESKIASYDPGFRSPLYPWMQLAGLTIAIGLIWQIGALAIFASLILGGIGLGWYFYYARSRVIREGAIYHIFERLGNKRFSDLDLEFRQIIKEKGLRDSDPFEDVVARAGFMDADPSSNFELITEAASQELAREVEELSTEQVRQEIQACREHGNVVVSHNVMLPHFRVANITQPQLLLIRCAEGIALPGDPCDTESANEPQATQGEDGGDNESPMAQRLGLKTRQPGEMIYAIFILVSPENDPGLHLRILAQIATRLEDEGFMQDWRQATDEHALKETLLHDDRFVALRIRNHTSTDTLIGKTIGDVDLPEGTLISLVSRDGKTFAPPSQMLLRDEDRLTIIGDKTGIEALVKQFGDH
jgi:amino acid transporter/mannitol/fructose-specific phosphotransferase system IIA component (Ntr-type)